MIPPTPADLASLPVTQPHAAGIDVGDASHWVCVGPGSDDVREFPAHTPGLRELVAWLKASGVTTVALEATGVYRHVLYLTLLEAGLRAVVTSPKFTRQIQGRPKTDKLDCQWIQRLLFHRLGLVCLSFSRCRLCQCAQLTPKSKHGTVDPVESEHHVVLREQGTSDGRPLQPRLGMPIQCHPAALGVGGDDGLPTAKAFRNPKPRFASKAV